jgi:hypothetical protein
VVVPGGALGVVVPVGALGAGGAGFGAVAVPEEKLNPLWAW